MLFAFVAGDGRLEARADGAQALHADGLVWLDICEPTGEEAAEVRAATGLELAPLHAAQNMESSARYFQAESGALHLRADFLTAATDDGPENAAVEFVIRGGTLFSFHELDLPTFKLMRESIASNPAPCTDAKDVMLEIYATDAEYCADLLEGIHRQLKGASRTVLTRTMSDKIASAVLARLARQEDLNSNVRHNINDNRRAISFLARERLLSEQQVETARQIRRDLDSLDAYTAFLFDKINFLLDATVGFINITQNNVVKIFSVAAVAMLPPTLIASIYGMNFKHIPELEWIYGYPFALGLMVVSVVGPFMWFRRKGWLK